MLRKYFTFNINCQEIALHIVLRYYMLSHIKSSVFYILYANTHK